MSKATRERSAARASICAAAEQITKDLVDKGLIIEAGWIGLRNMIMPAGAPQIQIDEMRKAFFAGALHLWTSFFSMLEEGSEETPNDMRRMDMIEKELERFGTELERLCAERAPTEGQA